MGTAHNILHQLLSCRVLRNTTVKLGMFCSIWVWDTLSVLYNQYQCHLNRPQNPYIYICSVRSIYSSINAYNIIYISYQVGWLSVGAPASVRDSCCLFTVWTNSNNPEVWGENRSPETPKKESTTNISGFISNNSQNRTTEKNKQTKKQLKRFFRW